MTTALIADVPLAAHQKALKALDEFDALVSRYEMLLDTQQILVRTANFAGLFQMAARGDQLARDAALCGRRFAPLVGAVAAGQFAGPRASEILRRSFASRSSAETLNVSASRLAVACGGERDSMGRELRGAMSPRPEVGLPPAYRAGQQSFIDRRG